MAEAETPVLEKFGAAYLRTAQLVADAAQAQFQMGRSPQPKEDTTERSKGRTSDPVPTTVLDTRRLALRAAVLEAESALEAAGRQLQAAEHHLSASFEKWLG